MPVSECCVGLIAASDLKALAAYRANGWQICAAEDGGFWLRVPVADMATFTKLPLLGRWLEDDSGHLTRPGRQVPERILPGAGWSSLAMMIPVGLPMRGSAGMPPAPMDLALEPGDSNTATQALLARWVDFRAWAEEAFEPRLGCLKFARCDDHRVFVTGHPLPPIRGEGFYRCGRLWLPGGYQLPSYVWAELVEKVLGLDSEGLALLHPDGSHECMTEENFVAASRAAVRLTEGEPLVLE